jgi:hypothetical protein
LAGPARSEIADDSDSAVGMDLIAELEQAMESLENSKDLFSMESTHTLERIYLQCLDWNESSLYEDIVERSGTSADLIRFSIFISLTELMVSWRVWTSMRNDCVKAPCADATTL